MEVRSEPFIKLRTREPILVVGSALEEVGDGLIEEGHQIVRVVSGANAKRCIASMRPKLILIDQALPDMDGLVLCAETVDITDTPIVIVSETRRVYEGALAIKLGARDFIRKPVNRLELLARIENVLRSSQSPIETSVKPVIGSQTITCGNLTLTWGKKSVSVGDRYLALTATEFRILHALMAQAGEVLSRTMLARAAWGYDDAAIGRSVDVHVHRLRIKLQEHQNIPYILSVRGFGYKLSD